jgi:hypothetical protein
MLILGKVQQTPSTCPDSKSKSTKDLIIVAATEVFLVKLFCPRYCQNIGHDWSKYRYRASYLVKIRPRSLIGQNSGLRPMIGQIVGRDEQLPLFGDLNAGRLGRVTGKSSSVNSPGTGGGAGLSAHGPILPYPGINNTCGNATESWPESSRKWEGLYLHYSTPYSVRETELLYRLTRRIFSGRERCWYRTVFYMPVCYTTVSYKWYCVHYTKFCDTTVLHDYRTVNYTDWYVRKLYITELLIITVHCGELAISLHSYTVPLVQRYISLFPS